MPRALSDMLEEDLGRLSGERLSIAAILLLFHERGIGFFLLLFSIPMALPIPVPPGVNVMLALPLLFLTAQQALGRHTLWLPAPLARKEINGHSFRATLKKSLPFLRRIEVLIAPRFGAITRGMFSVMIGILGFVFALTICIPIPLTNTIPSLAIAIMAIGVLMRDGVAVIIGAGIGIGWIALLAIAYIFLGEQAADIIKEAIQSWF